MAKGLCVIAVGSPLGADQAAWWALDRLRAWPGWGDRSALSMRVCDRPGAELLSLWQGYERVVLLDALVCEAAPGTPIMLSPEQLAPAAWQGSSHGFGVAETLRLAEALAMLPPVLRVIGIAVPALPVALEGLREAVEQQLPTLVALMDDLF